MVLIKDGQEPLLMQKTCY